MFFKQKRLWLALAGVLMVLMVFGAAMMGSVLGAKPQELPVAIVVLDQPAALPDGSAFAAGELIRGKLTGLVQLPLSWSTVATEAEARVGLDERRYYGALVLPADLSSGLLSLASPAPQPPQVRILVNEGMNAQAAAVVKQALDQALQAVKLELGKQLLGQIGQRTQQVPVTAAQALLAPIEVLYETAHPAGANQASGNAPGLLTQLMWISSLVAALLLMLVGGQALKAGAKRAEVVVGQAITGVAAAGAAAAFIVWMATAWYGMELHQAGKVWLTLWLVGATFFLLQSALLNWIGLPAMGLLVLLMFFSMPLLNMAPEFLGAAAHDWIYAWTPLRFASGALRGTLYFGGLEAARGEAGVLWATGGAFALLLLAASLKRGEMAGVTRPAAAEGAEK